MTTTPPGVAPRCMPRCNAASMADASAGGVTAVGLDVGVGAAVAVGAAVGTAVAVGGTGVAVRTVGATVGTAVDVGADGAGGTGGTGETGDWHAASRPTLPASRRNALRRVHAWPCSLMLLACSPPPPAGVWHGAQDG